MEDPSDVLSAPLADGTDDPSEGILEQARSGSPPLCTAFQENHIPFISVPHSQISGIP